ncbi:uncharacterized protein LOC143434885 [Arvicanthis niloticus]|uniref:uncharacterized protein LOC143309205 n=1 Tax=Arvicanthis niloticus TaxID=61156 RepID=UPI00402BA98A
MDKTKKMMQFCPSFLKETLDPEEHALLSTRVLPALSRRCSKFEPCCFCGDSGHCSENGSLVDWDLYSFCVSESLDYLRYYHRLECAKKRGTEAFQSKSQREPRVSPGDVDNKDKDAEEPDELSPGLLREKGLDLETCDSGDYPDQDPASDNTGTLLLRVHTGTLLLRVHTGTLLMEFNCEHSTKSKNEEKKIIIQRSLWCTPLHIMLACGSVDNDLSAA